MNIGLLAYSSPTGLGYQTKFFYDKLKPYRTMVVDLSRYNAMPTNHSEWYPNEMIVNGIPTETDCLKFLEGVDTLLVCETPLNYQLFEIARQRGIKIVQQCNPEFFDYFKHPAWVKPDIVGNPTTWMLKEIDSCSVNQIILRLPIEVKEKRQIDEVKTITHIVGRPTYQDRNGTIEFLKAIERIGDRFIYKIFIQSPKDHRAKEYFEPVRVALEKAKGVEVVYDCENNNDLLKDTDLLVLPRGYGGLCLPMNEALARGIPVVMTKISPNWDLLPERWLCKADLVGSFEFHARVDVYKANIDSLVETINYMAENIQEANTEAHDIAIANSWDHLKYHYEEIL